MSVPTEAQKLATDRLVTLYTIDASELGGDIYRFVSSSDARFSLDSLTSSGTTATATCNVPHALEDGQSVRVEHADQQTYNGDFSATVIDPLTFTYTLSAPAASPATGSIIVTRINGEMVFDGDRFVPVPFEAQGFEWNSQGTLPRPSISVSNIFLIIQAATITLGDLLGATFKRQRTFRKHLDDGTDPDPDAIFPTEIYRINRKVSQNPQAITFELAAAIDQEGAKIPGRRCLKRSCTHRYRLWDPETESFDYSKATCPYTGSTYFTATNTPSSDPADDVCGKQLSSCKLRFGNNPLPTRAFPGMGGK